MASLSVRWTRPAQHDLLEAGRYVRERNPEASERLIAAALAQVDSLRQFPERGRPGRVPNTRELVITGTPYIVAYDVRPGYVAIVGFMHGRRKWPTFVLNLLNLSRRQRFSARTAPAR